MTTPTPEKGPIGGFIDRHATVLTILCIAALVLVPTYIAYKASTKAGHAGDEAKSTVIKIQRERGSRIASQNRIDQYFCGKTGRIEKLLMLLVATALSVKPKEELSPEQVKAREVFERVVRELKETPKCKILIPPDASRHPGLEKDQSSDEAQGPSEASTAPPTTTGAAGGDGSGTGHLAPHGPRTTHPAPTPPGHQGQAPGGPAEIPAASPPSAPPAAAPPVAGTETATEAEAANSPSPVGLEVLPANGAAANAQVLPETVPVQVCTKLVMLNCP